MVTSIIASFITFFTVIDPIGTIPVFIAVTAKDTEKNKKQIAKKAILVALGVLVFFAVIGEVVLNAIEVPLSTFQIAGGIILFLFALTMIFGDSKPQEEVNSVDSSGDKAIFPLAMPSIASPGAILAAILLTENSSHGWIDQVIVIGVIGLVLLITWAFMHYSAILYKYIGLSGAAIISRVMGMILCSVAVVHILGGFSTYFQL